MEFSKISAKREVHSNTSLPQVSREMSNKEPLFTPKATRKRITNPKLVEGKKFLKIRAEIIEKEMKEKIAMINKTENQFFVKINKIYKLLARLIKNKGRRIKSVNLEMEMEISQQRTQKYKRS